MIEGEAQAREAADSFSPQWVSAPGETVLDIASEREWTRQQLADRLGLSARHLDLIVAGRLPVTEAIAQRLHSALGAPAQFWLRREDQYRERQAALGKDHPHGMAFLQVEFGAAIAEGDEALANDLLVCVFSKCASTAMELVSRHGMLIGGERRLLVPSDARSEPDSGDRREQPERQHG